MEQQQVHGTANKRMIEAIVRIPHGWILRSRPYRWRLDFGAGLLDLYEPKSYAYEATGSQPSSNCFHQNLTQKYMPKRNSLKITGINDLDSVEASYQVTIHSQTGKVVFEKSLTPNGNPGLAQYSVKKSIPINGLATIP